MMCTYVYIKEKKKKKKKGGGDSWMAMIPSGSRGSPGIPLVLTFFLYLISDLFPLSLPVHFVGAFAQFLSKERGGGGGGVTEVFLG